MSDSFARVQAALAYLIAHRTRRVPLDELAAHLALSPSHTQRLFTAWAGVSPAQFGRYASTAHALGLLRRGQTVLDAAYDAGLSGPARLHDATVALVAMTPGEVRRLGAGLTVRYGVHDTRLGPALCAATDRGLCHLAFVEASSADALAGLRRRWPAATLVPDPAATADVPERFVRRDALGALALHVQGTAFQVQVWEALLRIPPGAAVTYGGLARHLGQPGGAQAVGQAVGANPIAVLIPCHRVLQASGALGGYRWGVPRKVAVLGLEADDEALAGGEAFEQGTLGL